MITVLRKHHRWLMIVIAILAIPFVFYFSKTDFSARRSDDLGQIYGHTVTRIEFQRHARMFTLARDLGMFQLMQDLTAGAVSEESVYSEWTFNRIILEHEAQQLGIRPTSKEIVDFVRTLRPFQGNQGFDINKYNDFVKAELPSLGFNEAHLEELVASQLALDKIKQIVGSGVHVAESESVDNYNQAYGKNQVAVVRFHTADFAKDVNPGEDDIKKYYDSHKEQFKSDEKRKVEWAQFSLSDEQKKLQGKEHVDALQKVADRANEFSQALLTDKNAKFPEVVTKLGGTYHVTGDFARNAPDPQLAGQPQLVQYAFQMRPEEPVSDPVQLQDSFAVLHLLGREEARPLSLDEAKPKVVETLKNDKTRQLVTEKATQVANQLRAAIAAGAPIDAAAQQAGVKLDRIPPFSQLDQPAPAPSPGTSPTPTPPPSPELPAIRSAIAELKPGEVTEFVPTATGGMIAALEKRDPVEPAAYQQGRKDYDERFLKGKRTVAFYEWLRDRRTAAHILTPAAPTRTAS